MANAVYDLDLLRSSRELDLEAALSGFEEKQAFFTKLFSFADECVSYLTEYNAFRVANRDETRKDFFKEVKRIRDLLSSLGILHAASDLRHLENAAFKKDQEILERELSDFHSRMKSLSAHIKKAQIIPKEKEAEPAEAKPLILAVDDMPPILSSVVKMLGDEFRVMAVTSGKAALKAIEKHRPDLFLLDIEMPGINGYELAAAIRMLASFRETPIIFLTAKGTRDDVITAVKYGGTDYIVKPVDKDLLLDKIRRYL